MGLFDVVDEIAKNQIEKTETGDNRIFGVLLGVVTKNYDQNLPGRVCVSVTVRDAQANELLWARVAMPSGGSGWGHYFLPEVGDQVLIAFEQGNIDKPYIIGCINKNADNFLKKAADEKNQYKKIITRNGNTIYFEDNKEGDGAKDKIKIETAGTAHKIELDNENKQIIISDKEGKNKISIKTEKGQMEIRAAQKISIFAGDNIELTMNGSNGTTLLKTQKFNVEATDSIKLSSNGRMELSGGNVSVNANSMFKVESSGPVAVSGTPIKLG